MKGKLAVLVILMALVVVVIVPSTGVKADDSTGPVITPVTPAENSTITTTTPTIIAQYSSTSGINSASVEIFIDSLEVTYLGSRTNITDSNVTYVVKSDMALSKGIHNVTIKVTDNSGVESELKWSFTVGSTSAASITMQQLLFYVLSGVCLFLAAFGIALLVLKKTRDFSLRKYLKIHPIPKRVFYIGIPAVVGIFFVLVVLALFEGSGATPFLTEYVAVAGVFIMLLPYAIYVQKEKKKRIEYERSFTQFLYEMADAMRGGIDPTKAIIELSKTDTTVLAKHLKIAANGLQMGRPFEEMIEAMVKPIDSKLIKRYASLIGESAKIGGEVSQVVHRAAKDMDDLIKIEQDRTRSLSMQGTTIYISFGVLVIIVYLLISIYPSLGSIDVGNMFSSSSSSLSSSKSSTTSSTVSSAAVISLERSFLDMTIVTGLGSGLIIGLFSNGKLKFGLLHALGMMLAGTLFLMIMMA